MTPQPTVLVVDDQPELVEGISLTLEAAGYRALKAGNGAAALRWLRQERVDLILADIAMPEMNGYQLYENVRQEPGWVSIPFLFLTARALDSDVRYGKAMGVDDYLTKPIKPEDLLASVAGRLRRSQELAQAARQAARLAGPEQAVAEPRARPFGDSLQVGQLRILPQQHRVWIFEEEVELSSREFKILEHMVRRAGAVIEPRELLVVSHDLQTDNIEAGRLLRPLIRSVRRKLGYPTGEMGCIENVRGVGYRLVAPEPR